MCRFRTFQNPPWQLSGLLITIVSGSSILLSGCFQEEKPVQGNYPDADEIFLVLEEEVTHNEADFTPDAEESKVPAWVPHEQAKPATKISELQPGYEVKEYEKTMGKLGFQAELIETNSLRNIYDARKGKERYRVTLRKFDESDKPDYVWNLSVQRLRPLAEIRAETAQKNTKEAKQKGKPS